jgi:hypothetical protein
MDEALQSIARAFERNREGMAGLQLALLALLALVLVLQLGGLARRLLSRSTRLRRLTARLGLDAGDLALARHLARAHGTSPEVLLTHLEAFEQATARALAAGGDAGDGGAADDGPGAAARAEAIHRLRHLAGFDRLPPHAPLLSTRELPPGTAVTVGEAPGQIAEAGERSFTVELGAPAELAPGAAASLGLAHAREARYGLRCTVLASRPGAQGTWQLVLGHDEAPQRIQQRAYARVPVEGPLVLRPALSRGAWLAGREELRGRLIDVSGGGALAAARTTLPAGALTRASFAVGDALFSDVRAVVIRAERVPPMGWHLHLEFSRLPEAERARLVAAVERAEVALAHRRASG